MIILNDKERLGIISILRDSRSLAKLTMKTSTDLDLRKVCGKLSKDIETFIKFLEEGRN